MIVYLSKKSQFQEDVLSNRIEEKVLSAFRSSLNKSVGKSEISSWKNSLPYMDRILSDDAIPEDTGVAIEFNIPNTGKRIDFILTGSNDDGQKIAIIIELKQWQKAETTQKDAIVRTYLGGPDQETYHPSYQAWTYAMLLEDYNETVREKPIHLKPCAYLHNCESKNTINHAHYSEYTKQAPAFLKDDAEKLRNFIKKHVKRGDDGDAMYLIQNGKIKPSKCLTDHLTSLLKGNREFYMIDDQKLVYETAIFLAKTSTAENKNVLIVNGGPGTGKSVVAINLLVELSRQGMVTQYVTKNAAPRDVYESKLTGSFTKSRISNLFVSSGAYVNTEPNTFQALIVDEAHRLNEKTGLYNKGENQIKEIIEASCFSVFFLDEDQRIHWKDIGENEEIVRWADTCGATVSELALESQFRCNGSDGYLAWIDNALQIRETANQTLEGIPYEFKVCDSATELRDLIYSRNQENNKARMVAGYCWDWISKKDTTANDFDFPEEGFTARWNLNNDGNLWIVKPGAVYEIGCIHTCQGLELDYIGVIIGEDLIVRENEVLIDASKRAKTDKSLHGYKKMLKENKTAAEAKASSLTRNIYRTLMTRGLKGCYIYSVDPETNEYFKKMAKGALLPDFPEEEPEELPFRILEPDEVKPYINSVPKFDFEVAAGEFTPEVWDNCDWVELPEHYAIREDYFVVKVVGESMNKRIPSGSWCLFKKNPGGSRQGKIVLVQHRDIEDADNMGQYTIKLYHSEKEATEEGWRHTQIILSPMSNHKRYNDIILLENQTEELVVVGELLAIL